MIKNKLTTIVAALLVSVAFAAPMTMKAADATAAASPAASATPKAKKAKTTPPVSGKVAAVDKTAKTFTVGKTVFTVTDATKWDDSLTLDTLVVGTTKVTVTFTKSGDTNTATEVKAQAAKKK